MIDPQEFFDTGHLHSTRIITTYQTWPDGRKGCLIYFAERAYLSLVDFPWRRKDSLYNTIGYHQCEITEIIKPENIMAKGIPAMMLAMLIEKRDVSFQFNDEVEEGGDDEYYNYKCADNAQKGIQSYYDIVSDPTANYKLSTDVVNDWVYTLDHEDFFTHSFSNIILFPLMRIQHVISNLIIGRHNTLRPNDEDWHELIKPVPHRDDADECVFNTYDVNGNVWSHIYTACGYGKSAFHSFKKDSNDVLSELYAATGLLAFIMNCAFKSCLLHSKDNICFVDKIQIEKYFRDGCYYFETDWLFQSLVFPTKEVFSEYINGYKSLLKKYIENNPTMGLDACTDTALCRKIVESTISELEHIEEYRYWSILSNQQKFSVATIYKNFFICIDEMCPGCCDKVKFNPYKDIPNLLEFEHIAIRVHKDDPEPTSQSTAPKQQNLTKLIEDLLPDTQEIIKTNFANFVEQIKPCGFFDLQKVHSLPKAQQTLLIQKLQSADKPYKFAMAHYLGWIDYVKDHIVSYQNAKPRAKLFAELFHVGPRQAEGFINVLNPKSSEDRDTYNTCAYLDDVEAYYKKLAETSIL